MRILKEVGQPRHVVLSSDKEHLKNGSFDIDRMLKLVAALELLSSHMHGAPMVNERDEFMGFISEFDVLRALEAGKDLSLLTAEDLMVHNRIAVPRIFRSKRMAGLSIA